MKKIIGYLRTFFREGLDWRVLVFTVLLLAFAIYLNYWKDLHDTFTEKYAYSYKLTIAFCLLYGIPFLSVFIFHALIRKEYHYLKNPHFWLLSLFAIGVYSMRSSSYLLFQWLPELFEGSERAFYWYRIWHSLLRGLVVLIPVLIYWWLADRKEQPLYGLTLKNYDARPYIVMLVLMIPLIFWASFQGDFLGTYPRGGKIGGIDFNVPGDRKYFLLFELVYGLDFFYVEFFFRGFLILAFMRMVGPACILPMAAYYVLIHFGKPLGETISSFFGGSLLGIIAYYSRSIAGGLIVHVGIAWMMEIGAFLSVHGKTLFGGGKN